MLLICTTEEKCAAHAAQEIAVGDKCPGFCDATGCYEEAATDEAHCAPHQTLVDAGAGPNELAVADAKAARYGVTLGRLMREGIKMIPRDPGA